jgi:hypothetical protein
MAFLTDWSTKFALLATYAAINASILLTILQFSIRPAFMIRHIFSLFLAILVLSLSLTAAARDTSGPGFGGPNAVENQIEDDVDSWDGFRQNLIDKYGLTVSGDYTVRWARSATWACRNLHSATPVSVPRTSIGVSA